MEEELNSRGARVLPLSGKSGRALQELAERYLSWLDGRAEALSSQDTASGPLLSDMAWTAGVGRAHFAHRAAVVFRDAGSLREQLKALAGTDQEPAHGSAGKVAFAYAGEASQWIGMGKVLYESEPVVRAVLDRCGAVLREEREVSLLDVMFGRSGFEETLDDPEWMQPAIYALECALTALWSSVGVRPSVVVGQGLGEIAAAQAAGVFGLEEGLRFAAARGALIGTLPEMGAMTTALDDLKTVLQGFSIAPPSLTMVSSVTGRVVGPDEALDGEYWSRQAWEQVAFDRCVGVLADLGVEAVVEIGPQQVLGPEISLAWPRSADAVKAAEHGGDAPVVLSSLLRPSGNSPAPEVEAGFLKAVAGAYEAGLSVSFDGLFAGEMRRRVSLPSYPFQRRRHWVDAPERPDSSSGS